MWRLTLALLVALVIPSTAAASTITLSYTGNRFTSLFLQSGPPPPPDVYTTADSVSGVVELLAPLGANLVGGFVTPVSFSLSDGVNTLTDANADFIHSFEFWTDGSGQIVNWAVNLFEVDPGVFRRTVQTLNLPATLGTDEGTDVLCGPGVACIDALGNLNNDPLYSQWGRNDALPGGWTIETTSVPEPASLLLIGTGLAGIAARWRSGRGAARRTIKRPPATSTRSPHH